MLIPAILKKEEREKRNIKRKMGITADGLSVRVIGMRWWS